MKNVIIIGAGIAGLSAAVYAQRSGLNVTLIEQHSIVGGMCTSWKRKGYLFEGAVNWLTGSHPDAPANQLWRETGALDENTDIYLKDLFHSVEVAGQLYRLYRSIDKTCEGFRAIAPEDEKAIKRLYKDVKALRNIEMPITDVKGLKAKHPKKMKLRDLLKFGKAMPTMMRLSKQSCAEYIGNFRHPGIREALLGTVPADYAATSIGFTLATLDQNDGGYPEGGSLAMTRRMQKTFEGLGGTLLLNTKVQKILTKNGKAVGVQLDGRTLEADAVIITQETIAAVRSLFETPPQDAWLTSLCETAEHMTCTFVCLGIRAELPETPVFRLETPIQYAGVTEEWLAFNNYYGYQGYAPEGCTALTTVLIGDTYDFWKQAKEEGRYAAEKQKVADQIVTAVCRKWPELKDKIDVVDVSTPLTYERYTGAHHGSWMGILRPNNLPKSYMGELESIKGVYFAGHRLAPPGGLPGALMTGRTAAQLVCRQLDTVFA